MAHKLFRSVFVVPLALWSAVAGLAHAEESASPVADSLPGSPIPPGLGLSPQTPPVPAVPGGRAPSFGAPTEKSTGTLAINGRFYGYEAVGIGHRPDPAPVGYSGTALHAQPIFVGKLPFWGGAGATLNIDYKTPSIETYVSYYFSSIGKEYQGYYNPGNGPGFGSAYVVWTPDPIGTLKLRFKVGSVTENYGGPGQWGWGIFGPSVAVHGYGETGTAEWDVSRDLQMSFIQGFLATAGVPEHFDRGGYNSWLETGVSNWLYHAHLGFQYQGNYYLRLHYVSDHGTDERVDLKNSLGTTGHADGRMDSYLAELSADGSPWGHLGVTGGVYDFHHAYSVGDGVWWATDYTRGAGDLINKFLGPQSDGTGRVAMVSAEYDVDIASLLWYPRRFTGQAPNIRLAVAGMLARTLETQDPLFKNALVWGFGVEAEYKISPYISLTLKNYGENRPANLKTVVLDPDSALQISDAYRKFQSFSINPGIAFRPGWSRMDRIELIYSRRFYSSTADLNPAKPLDRHCFVLGGYVTF